MYTYGDSDSSVERQKRCTEGERKKNLRRSTRQELQNGIHIMCWGIKMMAGVESERKRKDGVYRGCRGTS